MNKFLALGALSVLAACSSSTGGPAPTPTPQDPGTTAPTATNPQGVAYPSSNLGYAVHTRIPNLKFIGYKATTTASQVDTTGSPGVVQLADFYNPNKPDGTPGTNGNTIIIHISAGSRWCGPCNAEASDVSGFDYSTSKRTGPGVAANLAAAGVVFVDALIDGFTPGIAATLDDLRGWVDDHQVNFTQVFDPNSTETASLFLGASIPWNADIDARSMEILQMEQGSSPTLESDLTTLANKTKAKTPMP